MKYYDFLFFQHFKQESCESAQVNAGLGPPGGFFQRLIRMTMMMMTMMTMKLLLKSQLKLFPVVLSAHSPVACLLAPETDKACHHPTPLTLLKGTRGHESQHDCFPEGELSMDTPQAVLAQLPKAHTPPVTVG
jgi:hypothetical protein